MTWLPLSQPRQDMPTLGAERWRDVLLGVPNRLAGETSPYLLQHAHNPVDWYPWGPEALARARAEDKPIFLSIGYSACHWCHVMERESFEDPRTAAVMNARSSTSRSTARSGPTSTASTCRPCSR